MINYMLNPIVGQTLVEAEFEGIQRESHKERAFNF